MIQYQVRIDEKLSPLLRCFSPELKKSLKLALRELAYTPWSGKPLEEDLAGYHSLRVGTYRIIYKIFTEKRLLHVVSIGPRESVYQDLENELKKKDLV